MTKVLTFTSHILVSTNLFRKFSGTHTDLVVKYEKNVCEVFVNSIRYNDLQFYGFVMPRLIRLAKLTGIMHDADHACCLEHFVITSISYQCTIYTV